MQKLHLKYNNMSCKTNCLLLQVKDIRLRGEKEMYTDTTVRRLDASDERQYMLNGSYEVYEKCGAPTGAEVFHYHDFYEIIYVLEGEYAGTVEDRTYYLKKGDFLLIDRNVMHKYYHMEGRHDSSKRIILWASEELLRSIAKGSGELMGCFKKEEARACHFPVYYEEMLRGYLWKLAQEKAPCAAVAGAKEILDMAYMAVFFVYLNELCTKNEYAFSKEYTQFEPMVCEVSDYIDLHIKERISVEELAGHVHMSKYYFLRRFKELTGMTVHSFVTNKRLIRANELLKENHSVAAAWQESGFGDYSSFLRNYKKAFGVSPKSSTSFQ